MGKRIACVAETPVYIPSGIEECLKHMDGFRSRVDPDGLSVKFGAFVEQKRYNGGVAMAKR